jgi:hypothetical protein
MSEGKLRKVSQPLQVSIGRQLLMVISNKSAPL